MTTYTCAMCSEVFEGGDEEEALAEKAAIWGNIPLEECDVVCDDCWQIVKPDRNLAEYGVWRENEGLPLGYVGESPLVQQLPASKTLLGFPVVESDDFPEFKEGDLIFGSFDDYDGKG